MTTRRGQLQTVGLAAALVVGVVGRFVTTSPMWLDEALSVNIASLPLGDIAEALRHDGHPPLYYWALHGWMELFGRSDGAIRALSGLCSVLSLPLAWEAGRRIGGRLTAGLALVVVALTPFCIRYATEARMYSLVMLLVLAGYLLLTSLLADPTWPRAVGVALTAGALLWTHYWSLYLLAVAGALVVLRWWRRPDERRGSWWAIGALAAGAVIFVPWIPSLLEQADRTGTPWALPARPTTVVATTLEGLGGRGDAEPRLFGMLCFVLVTLGLLGRSTAGGRTVELDPATTPAVRWEVATVGGTLALGAVAGYVTSTAYESRYAATIVPLLLLAVAAGLAVVPRRWPLALVLGAWVALAAVGIVRNAVEPRSQAGEIADRIDELGEPGDVVVACPDQLGPSLGRALRAAGVRVELLAYPTLDDGRFVDWRDYRDRNDAADPQEVSRTILDRAGRADVWLVSNGSYRSFEGDCEALAAGLAAGRLVEAVEPVGEEFEAASLTRFVATAPAR